MDEQQRSMTKKLILVQIFAFSSFVTVNYYNVFLKQIGFDSTQLGIWGAITGVTGMIVLPIWGVISDKTRSAKMTFILVMIIFATIFTLVPIFGRMFSISPIPLYVLIVLYGLVKEPTHSLQDAWMISTISPYGMSYASIRLWGSLGFGIVSIIVGLCVGSVGIDKVFLLSPICAVPAILIVWFFKESDYSKTPTVSYAKKKPEKINPIVLFKNYYYATAMIMTLALGVYMALTSSFYAFILDHAGVNPEMVGVLSGYGSLLQVVCMWLFTKYLKNIPMPIILIAGGLFGVAENIMYGLAQNLGMMFVASTLWSVGVSARVSILPSYLFSLVPREYAATAQTLNSTVVMMLTIVGNLVGGYLIANLGITKYNYCVASVQFVLVLLFALSLPFGRKVLKIEPPKSIAKTA